MPNSSPVETPSAAQRAGDPVEAGRAGEAVEQGDAVEQDAARQRAEDEIFEARLGRARVAALEARQHISGEALQLEADIERQQIAAPRS